MQRERFLVLSSQFLVLSSWFYVLVLGCSVHRPNPAPYALRFCRLPCWIRLRLRPRARRLRERTIKQTAGSMPAAQPHPCSSCLQIQSPPPLIHPCKFVSIRGFCLPSLVLQTPRYPSPQRLPIFLALHNARYLCRPFGPHELLEHRAHPPVAHATGKGCAGPPGLGAPRSKRASFGRDYLPRTKNKPSPVDHILPLAKTKNQEPGTKNRFFSFCPKSFCLHCPHFNVHSSNFTLPPPQSSSPPAEGCWATDRARRAGTMRDLIRRQKNLGQKDLRPEFTDGIATTIEMSFW